MALTGDMEADENAPPGERTFEVWPIRIRNRKILIQEFPDGRRYEIRVEVDDTTTFLREL